MISEGFARSEWGTYSVVDDVSLEALTKPPRVRPSLSE